MEETESITRRPVTVTIAVVFVYISGFASAALGIFILLSRYQVTGDDAVLRVSLLGAAIILLGLLSLAVAAGLAHGSGLSRVLITIYLTIQLPLHAVNIATSDAWDWISIAEVVADLFILIAIWTPPGSRSFRPVRSARQTA